MEQLPRLQARLANLRELRELIRALRGLAAAHLQEAQGSLDGLRRYTATVAHAIRAVASMDVPGDADGAGPAPAAGALLVVCSEHGFVGALNERLLDLAAERRAAGQRLVILGRRGAHLAEERGLSVDAQLAMATHPGGILRVAREVAGALADAATIDAVYAEYRRGASFAPRHRRIMPLDPALLHDGTAAAPPVTHLPPSELLPALAGEYLVAEITHALTESLTSESAARLSAMDLADHNIGNRLDDLTRQERHLRQESITSELLDVVTGAEALMAGEGGARG